jgi:hypothetical protein
MPTFIKTGFWESSVKSYKGWLNLEELIINTVPPQATIYTSNGTLTGNRIINSGGFTLTLNPATTFGSTLAVNGALTVGSIGGISQINGGSTVASTYVSSNFYVAIGSQNNLLYGERDVAIGLRNSITGRRWNYIYGNDNVIRGLTGGSGNAYNFIFGNNSTIGDSNIPAVFRAEYSYLIGFSNSVITTTSNASNNVIIGRASSVQNVSFNILIGNVVLSAFNYVTILTSGPGDVVGQYRTATEDNELSLSAGGKLKFHAAAVQNAATIFTTGNFAINSTSDTGQKLQVQGTTLLNGSTTINSFLTVGSGPNGNGNIQIGRAMSIGYITAPGMQGSLIVGGHGTTINSNSFTISSGGYGNTNGNSCVSRYILAASPAGIGANSVTNLTVLNNEVLLLNDGTASGINSAYNAGIITIDLCVYEVSSSGNSNMYAGKFVFRFKRYLINNVGFFIDISAVTNIYNSADATLVGTTLQAVANGNNALDIRVTLPATANTASYRMGANVTITKVNNS